jgi:hypothetical protein
MFNKHSILLPVIIIITFLVSVPGSFGKTGGVCGGSGKYSWPVAYSCYVCSFPICGSAYCCWATCNCAFYFDPAFPFFEYESSATKYSIQNFMPAILLSFFLTFFFAALIPKSRLFVLKIFSKIFQIKPQIIQTKCKYYSSYWLQKFKKYL